MVRQDRHQPVAGWRASRRGAMPASRDAIRPGTSQWRGRSITVRPEVEAGAGVTAWAVTAAREQAVKEAVTTAMGAAGRRHGSPSWQVSY